MSTIISIVNTKKISKKIHKRKWEENQNGILQKIKYTQKVSVNEGNEGQKRCKTFRKESLQNGGSPSLWIITFYYFNFLKNQSLTDPGEGEYPTLAPYSLPFSPKEKKN